MVKNFNNIVLEKVALGNQDSKILIVLKFS